MKSMGYTANPNRVIRSLYGRIRKSEPLFIQIGRHMVHFPVNSQVLNYKSAYRLYDTALGKIAGALCDKYPDLHAIDIGANVGDSAALIRESSDIPVLCIEGDPSLQALLAENTASWGRGIEIEMSFIGAEDDTINLNSANDLGNNACLVGALDSQGSVKLRTLSSILADHSAFATAKLLKTDTEGFDFKILRQSLDFIQQARPAIFLEYDPHFHPETPQAGIETLDALIGIGYSEFIYYDNFGNYLMQIGTDNQALLVDLDRYLASNQRHGAAVHYFDICALHLEDSHLATKIRYLTQK